MRPQRPGSPGESCARKGDETYCVSSVLKPQFGNSYGPENLFEGPQSAAWVEGQAGQGIGEWIAIEFDGMRTVRSITVRNGYQKSNDIFRKNNRVRQLRAVFSQGETQTLVVPDRFGSELLTLPKPVKAYWVKFIIDEVWAGNNIPIPRLPSWWSIRSGCNEPRAPVHGGRGLCGDLGGWLCRERHRANL